MLSASDFARHLKNKLSKLAGPVPLLPLSSDTPVAQQGGQVLLEFFQLLQRLILQAGARTFPCRAHLGCLSLSHTAAGSVSLCNNAMYAVSPVTRLGTITASLLLATGCLLAVWTGGRMLT